MVYGWCVLGWKVKWVGRKGKKIENLKEKKKTSETESKDWCTKKNRKSGKWKKKKKTVVGVMQEKKM